MTEIYRRTKHPRLGMFLSGVLVAAGLVSPLFPAVAQVPAKVAQPVGGAGDVHKTTTEDERQKKLRADAQQLLDLARTLKASVDATKKDELSLEVIREAERIEKLARAVKEERSR